MGTRQSTRLAVVTGASRGIGRSLTERLVERGRTVAALARSEKDLEDLATRTGAHPYVLDVADPVAVEQVLARVEDELGVPHLLVNNAGVSGGSGLSWELPVQDWWRVFEVNVRGTYLCSRAVLPAMMARGSGRIVNVSSGAGGFPVGLANDGLLTSAYLASKAAVSRFTEALAGECFCSGVKVFAISPGTVKTDMTSEVFADDWDDPQLWAPMHQVLDLVEHLDTGALDALSGRYVRAADEDWQALSSHLEQVLDEDTHVYRLRELP